MVMLTVAGSLGHHRNSQIIERKPSVALLFFFFRATLGETAVPRQGVELAVRGFATAEPSTSLRLYSVGSAVR